MRNSLSVAGLAISALLLLLATASATAQSALRDWRYSKPVVLPADLEQQGLVELAPDREVYASARTALADLRIWADDSEETPYELEAGEAEHARTSFAVSLRDKGHVAGGHSIFTADLGRSGIVHNQIEFVTASVNFRRTVSVEASHDAVTWMKVAEGVVYDFTVAERGFATRDTSVRYPDSTARFLQVKIPDDGEEPLAVASAAVYFVKDTPPQEVLWPSSILGIKSPPGTRDTEVEIDLGMPGIPSHRLAVGVGDVNFYRKVTLEASVDGEEWTTVVRQGELYAFDTPKFVGKSLGVAYREIASRYLRLVIHNEDSQPLTIQGARVWGIQRRLVFAADPGRSYSLYYGNTEVSAPSYDMQQLFPYLETENLPKAALGAQVTNPHFVQAKPPVTERLPWLLPAAVAAAAVLVALILLGILRQARRVLPPAGQ